jgi:hypothetical protein
MQSAPEFRRTQHATPPDLYADTDLVHGQRCCANQSFCCIRRESASAPAGVLARPALQSRDPGPGNVIDVPAAVCLYAFGTAALAGGADKPVSIPLAKCVTKRLHVTVWWHILGRQP